MIEEDDWRLLNSVEHLYDKAVNPTQGEEINANMEGKQECIFCWIPVLNNRFDFWFITDPDYCCICEECFHDFKEQFRFRLLDGWDLEWEK